MLFNKIIMAQRAIEFDKKERAAGRPGLSQEQIATAQLLGIGPGATDLLPVEVLRKISNRIINEVRGLNRVCLDISSKPPATIEWE